MRTDPAILSDSQLVTAILGQLTNLRVNCEDLPLTAAQIDRVRNLLQDPEARVISRISADALSARLLEVQTRLKDELSSRLFIQIPYTRRELFDEPRKGWEEVAGRFPESISDIEEMGKCYALSRYPAAVFHSMHIIEHGVISLGRFLPVSDPKPGWSATTNELKRILKKPYSTREPREQANSSFIEQMDATVEALKTAWRNKIDHAAGRLALLPGDVNPDVAYEIMTATRGFMRRLAMEMPKE